MTIAYEVVCLLASARGGGDVLPCFAVAGLVFVALVVFWTISKISDSYRICAQAKLDKITAAWNEIRQEKQSLEVAKKIHEDEHEAARQDIVDKTKALLKLEEEKTKGFPWLANAYADYCEREQYKVAHRLQQKKHPAKKAAHAVRQIAIARRTVEVKLRIAQRTIEYWKDLFPFLEEFFDDCDDELLRQVLSKHVDTPIKEIAEADVDPARFWARLPEVEYSKLTSAERNQRALDNYWASRKTKWQIGRDYERFVGFLFEQEGYAVYYQGILEGYDDLGRDLIARRGDTTFVIQCKRWSQHKSIHEKHVNQLFGTTVRYLIDHPTEKVTAALYTTTVLSDRARDFAGHLNVVLSENFEMSKYPTIKCNVSRLNGEKIYHLPFDQQYDKTLIEPSRGELYAWTAAEAEALGFRRAWRWRGQDESA